MAVLPPIEDTKLGAQALAYLTLCRRSSGRLLQRRVHRRRLLSSAPHRGAMAAPISSPPHSHTSLSPFRWGLGALQQDFCFARAEFARALVPKQREGTVALNTQLSPLQEGRIVGVPEPQRRLPITSLGGALVKKATGRNIARAHKGVTALQQHRHVSAGLIICAGDHSGRPCTWGNAFRRFYLRFTSFYDYVGSTDVRTQLIAGLVQIGRARRLLQLTLQLADPALRGLQLFRRLGELRAQPFPLLAGLVQIGRARRLLQLTLQLAVPALRRLQLLGGLGELGPQLSPLLAGLVQIGGARRLLQLTLQLADPALRRLQLLGGLGEPHAQLISLLASLVQIGGARRLLQLTLQLADPALRRLQLLRGLGELRTQLFPLLPSGGQRFNDGDRSLAWSRVRRAVAGIYSVGIRDVWGSGQHSMDSYCCCRH